MSGENNGWAEHKIHVTSELKSLRGDMSNLQIQVSNYMISNARTLAEIKSELKFYAKFIMLGASILSIVFSGLLYAILPRVFNG